eukprot:TRINITY_DN4622_c0_g1_i1.p1 TRINITY_DN4622_c0_g1~~TRINITY_DN4622_c0_g1_i1.p1  ORF type:complete len:430 (-),score=78.07 TRINITY_DN4622_c0_g1_i1:160-1449(-)
MKKHTWYSICLLLLVLQGALCAWTEGTRKKLPEKEMKLIYALEYSRHGARAPMHHHLNASSWKYELEELTPIGMRQHFLLGRSLYHRYVKSGRLIDPNNIKTRTVQVRSTDFDRTIMSAQTQVYGLLYRLGTSFQKDQERWFSIPPFRLNEDVEFFRDTLYNRVLPNKFVPVPIHTVPEHQDDVAFPEKSCPRLQQLIQAVEEASEYKKIFNQLRIEGFFKQFAELVGEQEDKLTLHSLAEYDDVINCNLMQSIPVPKWARQEIGHKLMWVHDFLNLYKAFHNEESTRLISSNLLKDTLDSIDAAVTGKNTVTKFRLFSAHDDTLNRIMVPLGLNQHVSDFQKFLNSKKGRNPPFASSLIFEVYKDEAKNENYIMVLYNNHVKTLGGACNNERLCSYSNFKKLIEPMIIVDMKSACVAKDDTPKRKATK